MNVKTTEKNPEHTFPKSHHATGDTSNSVLHAPVRRPAPRESKNGKCQRKAMGQLTTIMCTQQGLLYTYGHIYSIQQM